MINAFQAFTATIFGMMLSSLYFIDDALGQGLAIGLLKLLCGCKCTVWKYIPALKDVLKFINYTDASAFVLLSEFVVFSAVMMYLSRSRNNIEGRMDDHILQSKNKLEEMYRIADKLDNRKKLRENSNMMHEKYMGKYLLNMNIPDDSFDDAPTEERSSVDAASGDCVGTNMATLPCLPPPSPGGEDDVIRITGRVDNIDQMLRDIFQDDHVSGSDEVVVDVVWSN